MFIKTWRLIALLLASLSLTTESAHALKLPQKLAYDAQMYAAVSGSLYKYFASVGGVYQIGAITAAFLLALALRGRNPHSPGHSQERLCCSPRSWSGSRSSSL